MEKNQAQKLIAQVLNSKFDPDQFGLLMRNLLNDFELRDNRYSGNLIPEAFRDHIAHYRRIGKYIDPDGEALDILIVQTKTVNKLEHTRTALRNFVVRHLKKFDKQVALAAFYSKEDDGTDWRLSLIKIDYETKKNEQGKIRIKEDLVPAKRFSFLVGENEHSHTAIKQLLPLMTTDHVNPLVVKEKDHDGSIEDAFSVEKVTNEFFEQYKDLFKTLSKHFTSDAATQKVLTKANIDTSRFTKKLLGQIVFLYFIQKKGWLGVTKAGKMGQGSRRFLLDRFDQVEAQEKNYFNDFLRHLFYAALAREHNDEGVKHYFKQLDCKIPFLNGGLFEAEYDWKKTGIELPNELFCNDERNKAGDRGTGILDVFNRYNFTIKEDELLEKEVAIDPEMLGKVFENMLEITERKSKGAFYTPREIVHYMCQESLIHYLDNTLNDYTTSYQPIDSDQTGMFAGSTNKKGNLKIELENKGEVRVPKAEIEIFIRHGHLALEHETAVSVKPRETEAYSYKLPESIRTFAKALDQAFADIKICDPAIGSGAFPVGLLHEIVTARLVLNSFLKNNEHTAYNLKRHAIQESIYGVDIDASATDIARLRLWLSMIVDEEDYETIEALPNLDYKIVRGNSLVGFPKGWKSPSFRKIELLKNEFFDETNLRTKSRLKEQIDSEIQARLKNAEDIFGYRVDFDFRLFFSEVWHLKDGFDVVIGNPPYVQIQKFSGQQIQKDLEAQKYDTFAKRGDIYCLFYEQGYRILHDYAALCFITSNKWMRAKYGEKTRRFFEDKTEIKQLIDFGDSPIFSEATTYTNIMLYEKGCLKRTPKVWDLSKSYHKHTSLITMLDQQRESYASFNTNAYVIVDRHMARIKERIEKIGTPLKEWDISINYGIKTGFNEAFIIDSKKKDALVAADPRSAEIIKPILRGRDIKRYKADYADLWIIVVKFGDNKIVKREYTKIYNHLSQYEEKLKARGQCRYSSSGRKKDGDYPGQHHWLELDNNPKAAYLVEFEKEKIVYSEIFYDSAFYFDASGIYPEATTFVLGGEHPKYLTALLNSRLLTFAFKAFYAGGDLRGNTFRYKKTFIQNLPVVKPSGTVVSVLENLVDYIQFTKPHEKQFMPTYFEHLADGLVYELYFPEQFNAAKKQILTHLDNLKPISEEMSNEEKLVIVQSEFERLYDPNHPVRNNLETLDSIEEVRIIREALR